MKKISSMQMISILVCCLITRLVIYDHSSSNAVMNIIAELVSCIIGMIIAVPSCFLCKKNGSNVLSAFFFKSQTAGILVNLSYLIYFTAVLSYLLGTYVYYLQYSFAGSYSTGAIIFIITATAVYCASMGFSACARTSAVIAVITVICIVFVLTGVYKYIDFHSFNLAENNRMKMFGNGLLKASAYSWEFTIFTVFIEKIRTSPIKSFSIYVLIRALISVFIIGIVRSVLGDFVKDTGLAFFSLSSYSSTSIVERYDAFFLMIWTLCVIISASVLILAMNKCLRMIFPNKKISKLIFVPAMVSGLIAYAVSCEGKWTNFSVVNCGFIFLILFTAVLPLVILILSKRKVSNE